MPAFDGSEPGEAVGCGEPLPGGAMGGGELDAAFCRCRGRGLIAGVDPGEELVGFIRWLDVGTVSESRSLESGSNVRG